MLWIDVIAGSDYFQLAFQIQPLICLRFAVVKQQTKEIAKVLLSLFGGFVYLIAYETILLLS